MFRHLNAATGGFGSKKPGLIMLRGVGQLWAVDDQFVVVDETGGCELLKVDWVREAEIDFVWHWFGDGVEGPVNL